MSAVPILLAVDSLPIGGTERQVVELLRGLRANDRFHVVLSVLDHGGQLEAAAIASSARVVEAARWARFDVTAAVRLTWQARGAGIRLVHAIGWMSALAGLVAARCLRVPIINGSVRSAPSSLDVRDRVSRWSARRSDWIVANSLAGLKAYGLDDDERAQVIANGLDLSRFDNVTPAPREHPTVCMVANFSARKDHATLIRALPRIRAEIPDAELLLIGTDSGTLTDVRQRALSAGVGSAVRVVTDCIAPERYIAAADVCVLASPSESLSNTILEYMALARPVVATETCGDTALLVRNGPSGILVPHQSDESLAAAVITLLRDRERARRMGLTGREQVQAFTIARMVTEYERLYDRLLRPLAVE